MKRFYSILSALLILPAFAAAQDSLPEILDEKMDWTSMDAATGNFNRKDFVRFIIGTQGLGELFSSEKNENYLNDFHFTDLNGDKFTDVIYSGTPESTHKPVSYIFRGTHERKYPKSFEGPGLVGRIQTGGNWLRLLTRDEESEFQPLTWIRKYTCDLDSNRAILTAEVCYVRGTRIPSRSEISAEEIAEPALLRLTPEFFLDNPIDLNVDGNGDLNGNVSGIFPKGTSLVKIAARTENDITWDFVFVLSGAQQQTELFSQAKPGFTFIAGWIEDAKLK